MREFKEIASLLDFIKNEAKVPTRYPARFILVRGLDAWQELLKSLRLEVDEVFTLSTLCTNDDTFPYVEGIIPILKGMKTTKILVLPLAECLRFTGESRLVLRELATWEDVGYKRVYIPLMELDDIFGYEMNMIAQSWQERLPEVLSFTNDGKVKITVLPFKLKRSTCNMVTGIKAYLEAWEKGGQGELVLVTGCAPYLSLSGRVGNFEVRVYQSGYDFLKERAQDFLKCEPGWGTERQWQWLAGEIKDGEDFNALAARILNVNRYDLDQLSLRWGTFDPDRKWLFWIWSKLRAPAGTLFHMVLKNSNDVNQLEEAIANQPFKEKLDLTLLKERKELLKRLGIKEMPATFWQLFAQLQDPLDRLQVLTGLTYREKIQVILAVKELLEKDRERNIWWPYLEIVYPELAYYLTPFSHVDHFLSEYFQSYTYSRILDTPREELLTMARQAAEEKKIWTFPTRESILEKYSQNIFKFWIDGMGLEWLGLWKGLLSHNEEIKLEVVVARTNLPTTSEYNKGWHKEEEVDRRLDELAHKYNYQFPASLVEEIKVIAEDVEKMVQLLKEKGEVIITSDHGLTRFAFAGGKSTPPQGAQIHKWGRYAELRETSEEYAIYSTNWINDGRRIFLAVHEKFEGGAWSSGEVHGGATLEECLVPVIRLWMVRKDGAKASPKIAIFTSVVKLNIRGEGCLEVELTAPVEKVILQVAGQVYPGILEGVQKWVIGIRNLKAGRYRGRLEYEGGFLGEIEFEVTRGLMEEDLGL
ncbi:BREX-4 system phosphatase PglZ [Desulfofundulus thermocisternus]|uniref:BREX-4 system phosphatase PglZ n=1 Tax=Desulfofundulus thermocisternus TaxID=42471 RepID=UPI000A810929|nr:BREX-4 system phosphatase PglZ [Desulfofundulus thermocisternus]